MTLVAKGLSNTVIDAASPPLAMNSDWLVRRDLPVQRFVVNDDSLPTIPIRLLDRTTHAYTQLNGTGTFNTSSGGHVVQFDGIMGTTTKTGHNLVLTGDANYSSVQLTSDTAIPYTSSGGTNLGNSGLDVSVVQDVLNQGDPDGFDSLGNPVTVNPNYIVLLADTFYDVRIRHRRTGVNIRVDLSVTSDRADSNVAVSSGVVLSGSSNANTNRYFGWSLDGVGSTDNSARVRNTAPSGTTLVDGSHRQWGRYNDGNNRTQEAWVQFTGTPTADTRLTISRGGSGTLQDLIVQRQTPAAQFSATVTNNGVATASVATGTSTTARSIATGASEVYPLGPTSSGSLTGSWVNVTPWTATGEATLTVTPSGTGITVDAVAAVTPRTTPATVANDDGRVSEITLVAGEYYDFLVSSIVRNSNGAASSSVLIDSTSVDPGLQVSTSSTGTTGSTNSNNYRAGTVLLNYTDGVIPSNYANSATAIELNYEFGNGRGPNNRNIEISDNLTLQRSICRYRRSSGVRGITHNTNSRIRITGVATVNNTLTVSRPSLATLRDLFRTTSASLTRIGTQDADSPFITNQGAASVTEYTPTVTNGSLSAIRASGVLIPEEGSATLPTYTGTTTISCLLYTSPSPRD